MKHDALALDLARNRRGVGEAVAAPLSLGPGSARGIADVCALKLSWTQPRIRIWEVKATRSDFLQDTNSGKYERYLPFCHQFYFATPAGLIKKNEIPAGCGLVVRGERGWSGVRGARVRDVDPVREQTVLWSHLMAAFPGPWSPATRAERLRREIAEEVVEIRDLIRVRDPKIRDLAYEARAVLNAQDRRRILVLKALGLPADHPGDLPALVTRALRDGGTTTGAELFLNENNRRTLAWQIRAIESAAERLRNTLANLEEEQGVGPPPA